MAKTKILDWDSDVLGKRVAKIEDDTVSLEDLRKTLDKLRHENIDCVYFVANSYDAETKRVAQECGGVLADIKTTYTIDLNGLSPKCDDDVVEYTDSIAMPDLTAIAFEIGELSRFYLDKNMPADAYQKIYCRWMENSVNHTVANCVKVIKVDDAAVAVVTLVNKESVGQISLIGVDPSYRGQGLAGKLIHASLAWCVENNLPHCEVVTQKTNEAACKLYKKNGFKLKGTEHFYHFWL